MASIEEMVKNSPDVPLTLGESVKTDTPTTTEPSSKSSKVPQLQPFQFKPGQSGNPGGRKKKLITSIYEELLEDPQFREQFKEAARNRALQRKSYMAAVIQAENMADRVEGKVKEEIEVSGMIGLTLAERIQKARAKNQQLTSGVVIDTQENE